MHSSGPDPTRTAPTWRTPDVWRISLSAFFADLGYQAVLAVFPLYLVVHLGAPIWLFGVSQALAYGPGALFAYLGGRLADRYGRWRIAVAGNAFIPLLALTGLTSVPLVAVGLLVAGWWARNLRTPPRRALLAAAVDPAHTGEAFGFLHALDVGGGMTAALYAFVLLAGGVSYSLALLVPIGPLVVSTLVLLGVRIGRTIPATARAADPPPRPVVDAPRSPPARSLLRGIFAATLLYGFASFSIGFPVLTTAEGTHDAAFGVLFFVVTLGVSALAGLRLGRRRRRRRLWLATAGYLTAAAGSAIIALAAGLSLGVFAYLVGAAILGAALGAIETFEPTLVAAVSPDERAGRAFGALSAYRGLGLFASNLVLGVLAIESAWYPYLYAAGAAFAASVVLLAAGRWAGTMGDADL